MTVFLNLELLICIPTAAALNVDCPALMMPETSSSRLDSEATSNGALFKQYGRVQNRVEDMHERGRITDLVPSDNKLVSVVSGGLINS